MSESQPILHWLDALLSLHEGAAKAQPNAKEDLYERVVNGAAEVFPCDIARLAVIDQNQLVPVASSADEPLETCGPLTSPTSIAGQTYESSEIIRIDDLTDTRSASQAATATEETSEKTDGPDIERSLLSIPIGDLSILQLFASKPAAFSADHELLARRFAAHVRTAIERVETEAELRQERDQFEEFAGIVSHDLRNPLQIMRGMLDEVDATGDLEHLDRGYRAVSRMETLIDDLLLLAQQGERIGDTEIISLEQLTEECWQTIDSGDAALVTNLENRLVGDRIQLKQLFENLFRNAIEHGGDDVTVTVGDLDEGFYVADDGLGISAADNDDIFAQGYSTSSHGIGLGLAIVDAIADTHGWTVTATASENGGARFEITDVEIVQ